MTTDATTAPAAPRSVESAQTIRAILLGGAVVGIFDAFNATIFWALYRGVKPARIFQSIAAGLLGKSGFTGGASTVWLGAGLHFFIAFSVAAVYCVTALFWPVLLRKPVLPGIVYGGLVFAVMNYVVIPLSHVAPGRFVLPWFLADFLGHLFLIGLPVALIAHWLMPTSQAGSR